DRSAGSSQAGTSRLRPGPSDAALPAVSTGGALPLRGRSCHCGDAIFSVFCLGVVLPWAARRPCLLPLLLSLAALCSSARVLPLAVASFCSGAWAGVSPCVVPSVPDDSPPRESSKPGTGF